ncbi:hypothetical protein NQ176_g6760 [Zarea fungicola]|uniref:Uncharacterized protein n=1 Tax=Zarea fungicola TaxID=93591 RepID=A0ACC1N277_9HYPO|nr:hypothetical protein NQ176_g6760 [Lecanicillium fungicola]
MPSSQSSSSQSDGSLESLESLGNLEFADSHFLTCQTSPHDIDLPLPAFPHQSLIIPVTPLDPFSVPHVQPLGSIHSTFSVPSSIIPDTSSTQYYPHFEGPIPEDNAETFALCKRASSWQAYNADYATVDLYHGLDAGLQRRQSASHSDPAEKAAEGPSHASAGPNRPSRAESDRAPQRHPIGGGVNLAAEARVKKKRRAQLRKSTYRRSSGSLRLPRADASLDAKRHRQPPNKGEFMDNDDPLSSEDEDGHPRPKGQKEHTFACPFYRKWPTRHIDCMNRKLTRIQDVKQHLYRRHSQSPFYCPTCYRHFPSPDPRDEHIRDASCRPTMSSCTRSMDGISAQVHNSLKLRPTGRHTPTEQWYGIWDLIFPEEKHPESPYFGGVVSEMLGMLRDFCQDEGQRLIPNFVNPGFENTITRQDLPMLMMQMLDKIQDYLAGDPQQAGVPGDGLSSWTAGMMKVSPKDNESVASPINVKASPEPDSISGDWDLLQCPSDLPITCITGASVEPLYDFTMLDGSILTHQAWMDLENTSPVMNGY